MLKSWRDEGYSSSVIAEGKFMYKTHSISTLFNFRTLYLLREKVLVRYRLATEMHLALVVT